MITNIPVKSGRRLNPKLFTKDERPREALSRVSTLIETILGSRGITCEVAMVGSQTKGTFNPYLSDIDLAVQVPTQSDVYSALNCISGNALVSDSVRALGIPVDFFISDSVGSGPGFVISRDRLFESVAVDGASSERVVVYFRVSNR